MDNKKRMFRLMNIDSSNYINEEFNQIGGVVETDKVNEIGGKMAGVAIRSNLGGDARTKQISKDAITSLFRKYIGKDIPFFMKVSENDQATKYELVEVSFGRDMSIHAEYSELENGSDYVLNLHFYNANGEENDAPFAENKREFIATYILAKDSFDDITNTYYYNQYAINLFLYAVLTIRKAYFHAFPIYSSLDTQTYNSQRSVDEKATAEKMKTRLNKRSFRMFSFDSNNLENRTTDKPEPTEYFEEQVVNGLENYFNEVIKYLTLTDSGEKLINIVSNKQKYSDTIKRNFENGFDSRHTANSIRDHWFGV